MEEGGGRRGDSLIGDGGSYECVARAGHELEPPLPWDLDCLKAARAEQLSSGI